jgi:hypothetical protein
VLKSPPLRTEVNKWIFCALDKSLDRQSFDCGVVELNDYLHRYASQNHRKGITTTFVALASADDRQIAGYYSVSMVEITIEILPTKFQGVAGLKDDLAVER